MDILDPYQQSLGFKSEVVVPNGASCTWSVQICDHQFSNGAGPYTFKLSIRDYNSNTVTRQTSFTFTETPTPTPTPTPTLLDQSATKPAIRVQTGKSTKLAKKTKQGSHLKWKTTTQKVCKVKNYRVRGLRKGKCLLTAQSSASPGFSAYSQKSTVKVK